MRHAIKIDPAVNEEKRAVYWDDELSHHIDEVDIQELPAEARLEMWETDKYK